MAAAAVAVDEEESSAVSAAAGPADSDATELSWRRLRSRSASASVPSGAQQLMRSSAKSSTSEIEAFAGGDMSVPTGRLCDPLSVLGDWPEAMIRGSQKRWLRSAATRRC